VVYCKYYPTKSWLIGFSSYCPVTHLKHNSSLLDSICATNTYFQVIGNIHDIEAFVGLENIYKGLTSIFLSHWSHLALIFMWISASLFHIGWSGNYDIWSLNPIRILPIAHQIFDPHIGVIDIESNVSYSGIYNILYAIGFTSSYEIYNFVLVIELASLGLLALGHIHIIYIDSYLHSQIYPYV
jgi:hypothetical protein